MAIACTASCVRTPPPAPFRFAAHGCRSHPAQVPGAPRGMDPGGCHPGDLQELPDQVFRVAGACRAGHAPGSSGANWHHGGGSRPSATNPPHREHPPPWPTRCFCTLHHLASHRLQILESVIKTRWGALPDEQREVLKTYISNLIIKLSTDEVRSGGNPRAGGGGRGLGIEGVGTGIPWLCLMEAGSPAQQARRRTRPARAMRGSPGAASVPAHALAGSCACGPSSTPLPPGNLPTGARVPEQAELGARGHPETGLCTAGGGGMSSLCSSCRAGERG